MSSRCVIKREILDNGKLFSLNKTTQNTRTLNDLDSDGYCVRRGSPVRDKLYRLLLWVTYFLASALLLAALATRWRGGYRADFTTRWCVRGRRRLVRRVHPAFELELFDSTAKSRMAKVAQPKR
jgi:hypothetical protein